MKPLHDSIQVTLYVPKHVDETFKKLGYDVAQMYQRSFYDILRSDFDCIDEVPCVQGAREMLEQEVRHLDEKS